jgi:GT2 family glycosyltransferase/glycosyltransferase involved in cell wall biosynthesis
MHPIVLNNWFQGVPIQRYWTGCEAQYDSFINIDHFVFAQPLAKKSNLAFIFFPQIDEPPPEGVRLLAVSDFTKEHIKFKWDRDADVLYLPIKGIYKPLRKEKMILHVSRFTEPSEWADKAHRQMIQVFKMYHQDLSGWELVFAGALDPNQEDYFNELTMMAAGSNVSFAMNPNDQEMAQLYGRAAIYWHATGISIPNIPSAQEHLGLAPIEAQSAGCVPVCFNSGGIPEVVLHGRTGVLVDDPRQLGQITVKIAQDWSAWAGMSQQARRWSVGWQDYESFKSRLIYALAGLPVPEMPNYEVPAPYKPSDVTAVIPTFNNVDMLKQCITSLQNTAPDMKILIVNNGEPFGSDLFGDELKKPENVVCHNAGENLGFAKAHRKAEELVDTSMVLMLNDDVVAPGVGWLEMMLGEYRDDKVGIVGPKLIFPDGRLQHAGGDLDFRREDIGYHRWYGEPDGVHASQVEEVVFVTGACLLAKRELFHIEDYLLAGLNAEDMDICLNAKANGHKVIYQPAACLIHFEGVTKSRTPEWQAKVDINLKKFRQKWAARMG